MGQGNKGVGYLENNNNKNYSSMDITKKKSLIDCFVNNFFVIFYFYNFLLAYCIVSWPKSLFKNIRF